ncbi:hypothetical protein ACINKY_08325 [Paenibacillus illinoisensis]|uniref:Uncharacterized protein n=1 Tax=Paenibacillus illinoisensis TaxID=59845 RepID=A0ABW8HRC8_9BACL
MSEEFMGINRRSWTFIIKKQLRSEMEQTKLTGAEFLRLDLEFW